MQSYTHLAAFQQRSWFLRWWIRLSCVLVGCVLRLLYRIRIEGAAHLPLQGGVLIASNHISAFDTLLLPYTILWSQGAQIVWAPAKEELFRIPLVGSILRSWGAFPVRRGKGDLRAMRQMLAYMRTEKMMLFPEGTRSQDGRLQAGKRTIGKLVYLSRPAVIPTAIVSAAPRAAARGYFGGWRTPIHIRYGEPLDLQRYYAMPDRKETAEAIVQEIMGAIASLLYNTPHPGLTSNNIPGSGPVNGEEDAAEKG